jgi:hypothetical protein
MDLVAAVCNASSIESPSDFFRDSANFPGNTAAH